MEHDDPLRTALGAAPPAAFTALTAEQRADLAAIIGIEVERERQEMVEAALSTFAKMPQFLRRPILRMIGQ